MKALRFLWLRPIGLAFAPLMFSSLFHSFAVQCRSPPRPYRPRWMGLWSTWDSNASLQSATLELRGVLDSMKRYIAVSSGTGQFVFRGVAGGNYSLSVVRAGYLQIQYGQRGPNGSRSHSDDSCGSAHQRDSSGDDTGLRNLRTRLRSGWRARGQRTVARVEDLLTTGDCVWRFPSLLK